MLIKLTYRFLSPHGFPQSANAVPSYTSVFIHPASGSAVPANTV